ncbi:hypothetical protein [Alkalicoccus daliensis]|uniref:DUF5673 domain-containing protein n=1 Tax=Alkalicoccus daliensis TaxID=745820 RepID=A0A1H0GX69_9BACI|nr:hypothetical protein [Alkalicoccus daliensis]SDO11485.1 hypothetical protein SAMN04488053_10776 [Alkalicoccus daliensis]
MYIAFIACAIFAVFVILFDFFRARKMILQHSQAVFPDASVKMRTDRGEVSPLHFKSKDWRVRRGLFIASIAVIIFVLGAVIFGNIEPTLNLFFLSLFYPLFTLAQAKVPSFFITESGIYADEKFHPWEAVNSAEVSTIRLGSEAYGMFENSADYKEVTFHLNRRNGKQFKLYVYRTETLEKLISVCSHYEVDISSFQSHHNDFLPHEKSDEKLIP